VIVSCPSCKTKYQYEESRFGDSPSKRLKCTKCETVFEISKPLLAQGDTTTGDAAPGPGAEGTGRALEADGDEVFRDEDNLPQLAPLKGNKRYSLAVILGANSGQIFTVTKPRTVMGRGTETDLQLSDSEVSRRHAMLEIRGEEAVVTDLGSTNGTYVDGVRIQKATIYSNQEFSLGTTTLMFIVTDVHDAPIDH
jgi:predicted Zn finger-like uncharacterized protein